MTQDQRQNTSLLSLRKSLRVAQSSAPSTPQGAGEPGAVQKIRGAHSLCSPREGLRKKYKHSSRVFWVSPEEPDLSEGAGLAELDVAMPGVLLHGKLKERIHLFVRVNSDFLVLSGRCGLPK